MLYIPYSLGSVEGSRKNMALCNNDSACAEYYVSSDLKVVQCHTKYMSIGYVQSLL